MSAEDTGPKNTSARAPITAPGAELLDRIERYGKYFLIRKLAEGGMAEIFLAKQVGAEGFERNVVIKRMLKHLSEEPSFVTMFLDEARLAARLAHQNVVQIHDLGLADGCYFICMEYLAGEDFSAILRTAARQREYVPLNLVLKVMADAAHGLHFAHDFADETGKPLNIVHRDISPSNIFVTYEGQVKVLDFGIARADARSTRTTAGVVKGKYMYMAPEQARSDANHPVDRRADVFSLGVSLFEALTNVRPFARDNDLAILNAVLHGDFKPPRAYRPDLPVELEQVVLRAMSFRAEERYQTAAELAMDLERFLGSRTSASGGAHIPAYLRALFGEERIAHKVRVPSLDSLLKSGKTVEGFAHPDMKTVAAVQPGPPHGGLTVATPPPQGATAAKKKSPAGAIAAAVGALVLLGAGGAIVYRMQHQEPPPAQVISAVAEAPPPVIAPPPVAAVSEQDAGSAAVAETIDAGVVEPVAPEPAKTARFKKPIKLTVAEITRVVNRGSAAIMKCFDAHKADLPSDQGQVTVQFTILGSGKVTRAQVGGPLAQKQVGSCLQKRVSALRFPAHEDKEVTLGLPFAYKVER